MKLLFASIPTYQVGLCERQAYWHRLRRLGADRVFEAVTGVVPPTGRISLCRGLWLIASAAAQRGHECRWVDILPDNSEVDDEVFAWADQLWMYAVTPTFPMCCEMARRGKSIKRHLRVFIGGPHTRHLVPQCLAGHPEIDYVEAHATAPELLAESVELPAEMPGIAWRDDGQITVNASRPLKDYRERVDPSVLGRRLDEYYINTATSRGCCRSCSFCLDGQAPFSVRSLADVQEELFLLDRHVGKTGAVHFFDSSLWTIPDRCIELCEFIATETSIAHFSCDLEARSVRKDVLMALSRARMRTVSIGFESCRDDVLSCVGKKGSFAERISIAREVRKRMPGTAIKAYWLLGLPGSTCESLRDELRVIKEVLDEGEVDLVSAKLFVPYPGTPFFSDPAAYGIQVDGNFGHYDRFRLPPVCWPTAVGRDVLSDILIEAEKTVAECYATRLGISVTDLNGVGQKPKRYNGTLYVRESER